ncbi:hypothetical protein OUZ56_030102 [Daphnia magna]|uniref:Uncharacterized protein n=1 Tax=Daphnia magna TaxID=35525 RepID=A0ABQ9ZQB0_9CRUS|nr:hypothetical protein OUZ56_030102 [Daphnia magna]
MIYYWLLLQNATAYANLHRMSIMIPRAIEKPQVRYCSQDLTVPDAGLAHGRMLVAAWDVGFDHGCEDKAIKLILVATKQFLRELVVAIATDQKRYRIRENKVIYSIGQLTLNP